jgi:TRAP-type uncharacterized transport system fused permease subunit
VISWKLAKGLYIVPVLFAYTPILSGDWSQVLMVGVSALFGIYLLAGAMEGGLEYRLDWGSRIVAAVAGVALMWPGLSLALALIPAVLVLLQQVYNLRKLRT